MKGKKNIARTDRINAATGAAAATAAGGAAVALMTHREYENSDHGKKKLPMRFAAINVCSCQRVYLCMDCEMWTVDCGVV